MRRRLSSPLASARASASALAPAPAPTTATALASASALALALASASALALAPLRPAHAQVAPPLPFPGVQGPAVNVVQWDSKDVPKLIQRSEQLPLTDDELVKLSKAGFTSPQLVKLIEQRRCACDASADALIHLKAQGLAPEVLEAIALHALKPNRALTIELTVDFIGAGTSPREGTLYVFVEDGAFSRQLALPLREAFSRPELRALTDTDRSDPLITRPVRRLVLSGALPLKSYGPHRALVIALARTLGHPSQLTAAERKRARVVEFDYPRASLQALCRMTASFRNDPVTAGRWTPDATTFECEWN